MNFIQSIKSGFRNYFNASGRASRPEFWYWFLMQFCVFLLVFIPEKAIPSIGSIAIYFLLATLIPTIMLGIRRLHDTGRTGWWYLVNFIPIVGGIVFLIACSEKSDEKENRYVKKPSNNITFNKKNKDPCRFQWLTKTIMLFTTALVILTQYVYICHFKTNGTSITSFEILIPICLVLILFVRRRWKRGSSMKGELFRLVIIIIASFSVFKYANNKFVANVIDNKASYNPDNFSDRASWDFLVLRATLGDATAMNNLGILLSGRGYMKSSISLWKSAADKGEPHSQFLLSKAYTLGVKGVLKENKKESIKWLKKSASQGFSPAKYSLALSYYNGVEGVLKVNKKEAISLMTKLSSKGYIKAQKFLIKWVKEASSQGSAQGQYFLSIAYYDGIKGVLKENKKESIQWLKKSSSQGWAPAEYLLALSYDDGVEGVLEKNPKEAMNWYKKSAIQGNPEAQYSLGQSYLSGSDGEKNIKQAINWLEKARNNGVSGASNDLATAYTQDKGSSDSLKKARQIYYKAAADGDSAAIYNIGYGYYKGKDGVNKNYSKAQKWFQKSINDNCKTQLYCEGKQCAAHDLALMYLNGEGVNININKARSLFKKAILYSMVDDEFSSKYISGGLGKRNSLAHTQNNYADYMISKGNGSNKIYKKSSKIEKEWFHHCWE